MEFRCFEKGEVISHLINKGELYGNSKEDWLLG